CLRSGGKLAVRFQNLAGKIIGYTRVVACYREIRSAEQLFLAVAERVADGLLHLRIGEAAKSGSFACDELEDADAVFQHDRRANLSGFLPPSKFFSRRSGT